MTRAHRTGEEKPHVCAPRAQNMTNASGTRGSEAAQHSLLSQADFWDFGGGDG